MAEFCYSLVVATVWRGIHVPPSPIAQVLSVGLSLVMGNLWGWMSCGAGWIRRGAWGVQVESQGSCPGLLGLGVPPICLHLKLDPKRNLAKAISQGLWICCYLTMLSYKQGTYLKGPRKLYGMYGIFYDSLKGFLQSN